MKKLKYFLSATIISLSFLSNSQIYTKYPLVISVSQIDPSCNGYNDGEITINVSGGIQPYIVNGLSISTSSITMSNLSSGVYDFVIYDSGSGAAGGSITLSDPQAPVISATVTNANNPALNNGSIELTVTPSPANYEWVSFTNTSLSNPGAEDQYTLSPGWYSVTITDINGCQYQKRFTVLQSFNPVINGNFSNPGSSNSTSAISVSSNSREENLTDKLYGNMGEEINYDNAPSGIYFIPNTNGSLKRIYKN